MASVSSTSSLGNTSLRGFGGMASGIDRDAIIEKMTLGTTTKINNRKKEVTKLQWKQEAYRNLSDKIIDISDKYASYSSTSNLKDPSVFAKNVITVMGREEATRFVSATGSSKLIDNISIKEVSQLATSTVLQSQKHSGANGLETSLDDLNKEFTFSNLPGNRITFGTWNPDKGGYIDNTVSFTFPTTYKDEDGKVQNIDYTTDKFGELATQLNKAIEQSNFTLDGDNSIQFSYDEDKGTMKIISGSNYVISTEYSSALKYMGYTKDDNADPSNGGKTITIENFSNNVTSFKKASQYTKTAFELMTGEKVTFNYDGSKKEIELITKEEAEELKKKYGVDSNGKLNTTKENNGTTDTLMGDVAKNIQARLDKAFGSGAITVNSNGKLSFDTKKSSTGTSSSISITSNNYDLLKNMGLEYGASNKVNLGGKLDQSALGIRASDYEKDGELNLVINGERIHGITANSTIEDILSKINSTTGAGVKATYVDATGQFMLVSNETGAGREIDVSSDETGIPNLVKALFGTGKDDPAVVNAGKQGQEVKGQNAKIIVSYGNGVDVDLERSSNSFNLEGLNVTVSGVFGGDWVEEQAKGEDGNPKVDDKGNPVMEKVWKKDSSETVTFSAKADVDGVVEKVKSFFEEFNALVADISGQVRTRPDSSYEPLTDEQKDELDETSIENWENKAKQGILYGDSIIRDLSADVEGIFAKLLNNGASYEDLKAMGITYSEDWNDGGTLVFDEAAFRSAMETDPDKVANIFTGGGDVKKGLINIVEDTFTPYATRYASRNSNGRPGSGSYGRLIEMAGSEKKPTTLFKNEIYKQIEEMNKLIDSLQDQLKVEQDRYISQFTTMESLLNQFNTQSSYLSQLTA